MNETSNIFFTRFGNGTNQNAEKLTVYAAGDVDFCIHVLREEWGYKGAVITDWGGYGCSSE